MVGFADKVGLVSLLILQKKSQLVCFDWHGYPKPFKSIPKLVYDCHVSRRLKQESDKF